jgi:hypothetical protein
MPVQRRAQVRQSQFTINVLFNLFDIHCGFDFKHSIFYAYDIKLLTDTTLGGIMDTTLHNFFNSINVCTKTA